MNLIDFKKPGFGFLVFNKNAARYKGARQPNTREKTLCLAVKSLSLPHLDPELSVGWVARTTGR